jgi:hypothetical protein
MNIEEMKRAWQPSAQIPMCWKCSDAIMASIEPGISEFTGCKRLEGVVDYIEAKKQCPLIWDIEPMENPCPDKWPGKWFKFRHTGTQEWGNAHESTLHLYVGEALAKHIMGV